MLVYKYILSIISNHIYKPKSTSLNWYVFPCCDWDCCLDAMFKLYYKEYTCKERKRERERERDLALLDGLIGFCTQTSSIYIPEYM